MYDLPKKLNICGTEYGIRSDYRAVLDVCTALSDPELSQQEKSYVALDIFYPDFEKMPPEHYQEALKQYFLFINCGSEEENKKSPKLVDWAQDFNYIAAPVNRVMGREIRSMKYMHWWTFVGAYMEIGDCTFAQIVRIRDRKAKGKPLDKQDAEWYRNNRNLVDLKHTYSDEEKGLLEQWGIK